MRLKLSQEVYNLIQSLSRTEKAYLKKWTIGKPTSKVAVAFDMLNSTTEFDESALSEKLEAQGINHREIYKRLLPILLKSLNQYHSSASLTMQLNELLSNIELMQNKGQIALCENLIKRGIEKAEIEENHVYSALFRDWKTRIRLVQYKSNILDEEENLQHSINELDSARVRIIYRSLYRQLYAFMNKQEISSNERNEIVTKILEDKTLQQEPRSASNKRFRNEILTATYYFIGFWEEAIERLQAIADNPIPADAPIDKVERQIVQVLNLSSLYQLVYNAEMHNQILQLARSLIQTYQGDLPSARLDSMHANILGQELLHLNYSGRLNQARIVAQDIVSDSTIDPKILVSIKLSQAFIEFLQHDFQRAIQLINIARDDKKIDGILQLQKVADWMEILSVYKLGDESLFESRHRSLIRKLQANENYNTWNKLLLRALKSAFGRDRNHRNKIMKELLPLTQEYEREIRTEVRGLDINLWIESEAINRPMFEMIKERYEGVVK